MLKPAAPVVLVSMLMVAPASWGQEHPTATAPPNLAVLEHTPTGVMYAEKDLVKQYKQLQTQLTNLRGQHFHDSRLHDTKRKEFTGLEKDLQQLSRRSTRRNFTPSRLKFSHSAIRSRLILAKPSKS